MTVVDKPDWVSHGGATIWSIDVDPEGKRVATAGQDNRVRVWALGPILHARQELDPAAPRALATLAEFNTAVNVARFSPKGGVLASGTDDGLVYLHRLVPGLSKPAFNSKDPPNVENWRQATVLRAHNLNVADVAWCPDGTRLASASMDNRVIVWDAATGRQLAVLTGHIGCVKGVAWDPFNHYLASQGEKGGVLIWSVSDWRLVQRVEEPWRKTPTSSAYHTRLGWSPDGQLLAGTSALDPPVHQAPLVRRNTWEAAHQYCGHRAAIVVARFNPHMFYKRQTEDREEAVPICALGAGDRTFTVWSLAEAKPLLVGDTFFKHTVMDLAWAPDGYSLLVASYDGTVAAVTFTPEELGQRLPASETAELFRQLYGDRQGASATLAADASVLALQLSPHRGPGPAGAGAKGTPPRAMPGLSARIAPPAGAAAASGQVRPAGAAPAAAQVTTTAGGKKRLTPIPVGGTSVAAAMPPPAAPQLRPAGQPAGSTGPVTGATGRAHDGAPPAKRLAATPVLSAAGGPSAHMSAPTAPTSGMVSTLLLPPPPVQAAVSVQLGERVLDNSPPHFSNPEAVVLEAANNMRDAQGAPLARLQCFAGGAAIWTDILPGAIAQLAGTLNFSAAVLAVGDLLLFSPAGRRLLPPICLGAPAAFVATDGAWALLVVSLDGRLRVWDVQRSRCSLDVSAAPVLQRCGSEVVGARLSGTGVPLLVLANHHAYAYLDGMAAWARVADDSLLASQFHSAFAGSHGELGRVQAAAAAARSARDVFAAALAPPGGAAGQVRAHLETNMAAAAALKSPLEWRRWLTTYVRQLAAHGDVARLREVVADLLGPVRWTPSSHPETTEASAAPLPGAPDAGAWCPTVLGFSKRRLLREEVLREIARVRTEATQLLVAEAMEQLAEADATWRGESEAARNGTAAALEPRPGRNAQATAGVTNGAVAKGATAAAGVGASAAAAGAGVDAASGARGSLAIVTGINPPQASSPGEALGPVPME